MRFIVLLTLGVAACGSESAPAPSSHEDAGPNQTCTSSFATCDGSVAHVCTPGATETTSDCAALGLECADGTCRTSLAGLDCVTFRTLRPVQTNVPLTGSLLTAFAVDSCATDGKPSEPVVGLELDAEHADFEILEDGKPVSVSESAARVFNDRTTEVMITVVMDNSPSVKSSGALEKAVAAAHKLVGVLLDDKSSSVRIRVAFFSKAFAVQQDFTSDLGAVDAAIDALLTDTSGSNTTNLYGAVVDALDQSTQAQAARRAAMRDGVLTLGQVVLFTDGSDQAAKTTFEEAKAAVAATADDVFLLALEGDLGGELTPEILAALGRSGYEIATSAAALTEVFDKLATRIAKLQRRVYVLGYCSPKLAGTHALTVSVKGVAGSSEAYSFDAKSFDVPGPSCSAQAFQAACDGKDCGGLLCGGCLGMGECTEALQCVCTDPHFALPDCTVCSAKYTGPECSQCLAGDHFTGPECDQCAAGFAGPDCAQCADAHFVGTDCDECAPKFTGAACDECLPPFSGYDCEDCSGPPCPPGSECGNDACGDPCPWADGCNPGEICVGNWCECGPACDGKACGPDGCGGTCGTCSGATPDCKAGVCVEKCAPECAGKDCGDDGCGGSCGTCPGAAPFCVDAICALTACPAGCEGQQCACGSGFTCTGGACDPCGGACEGKACGCAAGLVCHSGACCAPSCAGPGGEAKQCGSDGCGGICGSCAGGLPCETDGQCCQPTCADKECGDDGCGGDCGACPGVVPYCALFKCSTTACTAGCQGQTCGCAAGQACDQQLACAACESKGDPAIAVGAPEQCDGKDNDCDGTTDVRDAETGVGLCTSFYDGQLARSGDLAFVPCAEWDVRIYSIVDPDQPVQLASFFDSTPGWAGAPRLVAVAESGMYAVSTSYQEGQVIRRYDVTNPATPVSQGALTLDGEGGMSSEYWIRDLAASGDQAYAGFPFKLSIIDFADTDAPASAQILQTHTAMDAEGAFAFLAVGTGTGPTIHVIDATDPSKPVDVLTHTLSGMALQVRDISVHGGMLYVLLGEGVLRLVDVAIPTAPVNRGSVEFGSGMGIWAGPGGVFGRQYKTVIAFDASDPDHPAVLVSAALQEISSSKGMILGTSDLHAFLNDLNGDTRYLQLPCPESP